MIQQYKEDEGGNKNKKLVIQIIFNGREKGRHSTLNQKKCVYRIGNREGTEKTARKARIMLD